MGRQALRAGRYETARRAFEAAADRGEAAGFYEMGLLYWYGQGVVKSLDKAVALFTLAAERGDADAQHAVALALLPNDRPAAERWLVKASEAGHAPAMTRLAELFLERDRGAARALLARAAEAGYPPAMIAYGHSLAREPERDTDPAEGLAWLYAAVSVTGDADVERDARALAQVLHARAITEAQKRGRSLAKRLARPR